MPVWREKEPPATGPGVHARPRRECKKPVRKSRAAIPHPDRPRAVFNRLDAEPGATQGHSKNPPVFPLRKEGKRPDAADFPPCEGGWGGVRAAAHAMHLKTALDGRARAAGPRSHSDSVSSSCVFQGDVSAFAPGLFPARSSGSFFYVSATATDNDLGGVIHRACRGSARGCRRAQAAGDPDGRSGRWRGGEDLEGTSGSLARPSRMARHVHGDP